MDGKNSLSTILLLWRENTLIHAHLVDVVQAYSLRFCKILFTIFLSLSFPLCRFYFGRFFREKVGEAQSSYWRKYVFCYFFYSLSFFLVFHSFSECITQIASFIFIMFFLTLHCILKIVQKNDCSITSTCSPSSQVLLDSYLPFVWIRRGTKHGKNKKGYYYYY